MKEYFFYMDLSYDKCLGYYYGHYTSVQVIEDGGKSIRFPAERIRPFISSIGIRGRFRLILDDSNKFLSLEKVT
ncbi:MULTISPECIES: DUF2835 domain-containing protein [Pseudoalteromonas]|uniref:DUF2835 domain-containing protein n=2 Tax=Pseudoalteromonas TaxID=53246 RepID=A0A8I2H5B1_9GAMM|nr:MULTISPECIES: DUF2835 domain-containing protein [Pseudoalteromonas]ASD66883.1 hypothetical protein B1L02_07530 [Pseudoalteromonas piscicida]AUJ69868.1 hypothetical protein PNC201_07870 [Pseudoalteromonas sp. NC201]AXQ97808.1 DUF2835 family protein [Pseudoalteromonas piscicida]KID34658.1 hypothetical protein QT15_16280 [Pseudoalteromonas flavipulchra NCIMB 2033 = ATCC BAA-314]KJY91377.1 hypothetical protein TW75_05095 [Pseudoalteromonas piscicida]